MARRIADSSPESRLGLISFSDTPKLFVDFSDFERMTVDQFQTIADELPFRGGRSRLDLALQAASQDLFTDRRSGVPRVSIRANIRYPASSLAAVQWNAMECGHVDLVVKIRAHCARPWSPGLCHLIRTSRAVARLCFGSKGTQNPQSGEGELGSGERGYVQPFGSRSTKNRHQCVKNRLSFPKNMKKAILSDFCFYPKSEKELNYQIHIS